MGDWVDFKAIKESVSIEQLLDRYRVQLRRVSETSRRGPCPLPSHKPEKAGTSFSVNTVKNVWACQSTSCVIARGGRRGGNVLDFVAQMERCSVRDAALKLQAWFGEGAISEAAAKFEVAPQGASTPQGAEATNEVDADAGLPTTEYNRPLQFELKLEAHSYLAERRLNQSTIERFGLGYCKKGLLAGRIAIPIHDELGQLVAYLGRAIDGSEPKYKLPPKFVKSAVLFNLHRIKAEARSVVIVEGVFDALWLHQCGFEDVVALLGSSLSEHQAGLLRGRFHSAALFLDGDRAGREASDRIAAQLSSSAWVRTILCPEGRQPDGLSRDELQALLEAGGAHA